jgi:hypothetical protein
MRSAWGKAATTIRLACAPSSTGETERLTNVVTRVRDHQRHCAALLQVRAVRHVQSLNATSATTWSLFLSGMRNYDMACVAMSDYIKPEFYRLWCTEQVRRHLLGSIERRLYAKATN